MKKFTLLFVAVVMLAIGIGIGLTMRLNSEVVQAQAGCRTFSETGKTVCGRFLILEC